MSTATRNSNASANRTPTRAPNERGSVWLVAEREIGSKLRSKAFIISTAILFAIALAGILFAGFASKDVSGTPVAAAGAVATELDGVAGLEITPVADRAAAEALVASGDVDAAVVADASSPVGYVVIADSSAPTSLLLTLAQVPPVELLNPAETDAGLRYLVAIGFGVVFLMAASLFGSTIAQSVVEEKQTRVVEILISAIPARSLLAGKVIGSGVGSPARGSDRSSAVGTACPAALKMRKSRRSLVCKRVNTSAGSGRRTRLAPAGTVSGHWAA